MKHIAKNEEPVAFTAWKEREAESLDHHYAANNADAAWGHLHPNLPVQPEEGIQYYSKRELATSLLEEQGYLCCYCNRLIHQETPKPGDAGFNDRRTTVEHLDPKEADARNNTFGYKNLAASCMGGEVLHKGTKPRVSYCNQRRGNSPLAISPVQTDCEIRVFFSLDGQIFGDSDEVDDTLHEVLGLHFFDEIRRAAIRAFYYANVEEHEGWEGQEEDRPLLQPVSIERARQIIENLSEKGKDSGKYEEFCSAIIHVLKTDILMEV